MLPWGRGGKQREGVLVGRGAREQCSLSSGTQRGGGQAWGGTRHPPGRSAALLFASKETIQLVLEAHPRLGLRSSLVPQSKPHTFSLLMWS